MNPVFRRYLVRGGIPVGIMIGIATAFFGPHTAWIDFALTTALSGLLFVGLVAAVAEPFIRKFPRSGVSVFLLCVLMIITTLVGGLAIFEGAVRIPHGRWIRLPDPPEPVRAFAGPTCYRLTGRDDGVIFAVNATGKYLVYHQDRAPDMGWTLEAGIPDSIADRGKGCRPMMRARATPPKSGQVVATYRVDDNGVDCGGRRHYLLLADGSIWNWSDGSCAIAAVFGRLLFAVALLLVGAAIIDGRLRLPWRATRGEPA
jgi:hypothetical protein